MTEKETIKKTTAKKKPVTKSAMQKNKPNKETEKKTTTSITSDVVTDSTVQKTTKIKYNSSDLIPCKSVRYGKMQYISKKSGTIYEWSDFGDVCELEYSDLLALKASKSVFLYDPWFLILDEDLQDAWKLKELYSYFNNFDEVEEFLKQSASDIAKNLESAPRGYQDVIRYTARNMLQNGTLDSVAKIKTIDRILHTQLSVLLGG